MFELSDTVKRHPSVGCKISMSLLLPAIVIRGCVRSVLPVKVATRQLNRKYSVIRHSTNDLTEIESILRDRATKVRLLYAIDRSEV